MEKNSSVYHRFFLTKVAETKNKKTNQILPATMEKSFFFQENKLLRRKQFLQTINFIELINKAMKQTRDCNKDMQGIRTDLKIFLNIQTCSDMFRHLLGIFRSYSDIFRTLCNPGIKRTCYIQNPGKFRTRGIFRTLVYSEPWHIKN